MAEDTRLTTIAELEALYGRPSGGAVSKETDHLIAPYRRFVEAAPFLSLATRGEKGVECSPRGDAPGFVKVLDPRTLLVPDRKGNRRMESLRNILTDPHVALLFLIPGVGETLRVRGRAIISTDPALLALGTMRGTPPLSALVVSIDSVLFQCSRAIARSGLWTDEARVERASLPTAGEMLKATDATFDGDGFDQAWKTEEKAGMV
ncbi:pyridoxamine 5'-phosphate oxidase family protein [Rhodospirillum rubrum]|uniref:Pyridoxamine 5'-phosphate oxidase-related, FMN-binding n=1 Tax=Rhodospirillum rubrum (strain ATCC 11170 / ATH 1.1.1 / DSM 467 / LMG 4362 / NCIMB 8255 / S1) TaxID=269796 RepID=Q2RSB1_RHORT|nr:pyridoxamine 5'-phosphate oxidase family protein [Rhodospirillum rubrum]ABC22984.1 Pyridoxamine 5'-phosphate oxidase-related, FMN-binding [Rhodospirillum rubrum ATCC 11170]AEO48714.1 pyridoxamine 5'-phosphate oxidase-related, FMN-binding protein [Rhodospirillum rubrum F11]MBK5954609.1 pyridoxamine 5'-phosphate oxidase [Rhodospirillum rubrum]QXG78970.1 pyridoxamine 5'-phosphate oxidase family protein [Rhodospirillum rubrum]HAP98762.1 pyridoxamine 5'-phosphate oxidase family protein [Rhodospi